MSKLAEVLGGNSDQARQIAAAAQQQVSGIEQISDAMVALAQGGQDTAATTMQLEAAADILTNQSQQIRKFVTG